jgi:hypothetical protein
LMLARSGRTPVVEVPLVSGDTPVVLVGGSLIFKAPNKGYDWQELTAGQDYFVTPSYAISTIVIKSKAADDPGDGQVDDDSSPASDQLRANVSNATSWQIDEFTTDSDATPVVSVTFDGSQMHVIQKSQSGILCPISKKRLFYSPTQPCPASPPTPTTPPTPPIFSKVSLTITAFGQKQTWGTINCIDVNNVQGKCRIVFRK